MSEHAYDLIEIRTKRDMTFEELADALRQATAIVEGWIEESKRYPKEGWASVPIDFAEGNKED